MVMGRDSRSKGRGFESRHRILDGHFSHIFVVKICNVCLKRPKINEKRPGMAHFLKKRLICLFRNLLSVIHRMIYRHVHYI